MVTSSHNPWNWNGVKFKGKFGGSATPAIMKKIEDELHAGAMPTGKAAAHRGSRFQAGVTSRPCANSPIWISSQKPNSSSRSTPCTAQAAA